MPESADRKKYEPLGEFLSALPPTTKEITLPFDQVAQIIGDTLRRSSAIHCLPLLLHIENGGPTKKAGRVLRTGERPGSKSIKSIVRRRLFDSRASRWKMNT
jgi:hypothetical protein